ncbi:MAG: DNA methyltransferase [Thermodesulfobacteriota bacterium]
MFKNQTIWTGDNLPVLRGLDEDCVDLIYLDPPFNSKKNYQAPIGSEAAGAAFKDTWTLSDVDNVWHGEIAEKEPAVYRAIDASELTHNKGMKSYLIMMAVRLIEMRRILKKKGSIYLHCDPTASHYLKMLMDAVFDKGNFRNEIIWHYGGRGAKAVSKQFPKNADTILFYCKTGNAFYEKQYQEVKTPFEKSGYRIDEEGRCYRTAPRGDYTDESIAKLEKEGRIHRTRNGKVRVKYFEEFDGTYVHEKKLVGNVWNDIPDAMHISKNERTGYPTQKPIALLERIIKASSKEDDIVLDPFCGCATTLVAAEKLNRRWIGIDISEKAVDLVTLRMRRETNLFDKFDPTHRKDIPKRKSGTENYRDPEKKKFLYGQQEGKCNGCGVLFPYRNMTVDHIIPQSKGGGGEAENLQLLCGACNSMKGNRTQEELIVRLKDAGVTYR